MTRYRREGERCRQNGQGMLEYALIGGLIALVVIAILIIVGRGVKTDIAKTCQGFGGCPLTVTATPASVAPGGGVTVNATTGDALDPNGSVVLTYTPHYPWNTGGCGAAAPPQTVTYSASVFSPGTPVTVLTDANFCSGTTTSYSAVYQDAGGHTVYTSNTVTVSMQ